MLPKLWLNRLGPETSWARSLVIVPLCLLLTSYGTLQIFEVLFLFCFSWGGIKNLSLSWGIKRCFMAVICKRPVLVDPFG